MTMAQNLSLDAAWEKQISPQDRNLVETTFAETKAALYDLNEYTYLRHDVNHDQALLVLVLVHNWSEIPKKTTDETLVCLNEKQEEVARHSFSFPFQLSAKTSTPWTLIFPKGTYQHDLKKQQNLVVQNVSRDYESN